MKTNFLKTSLSAFAFALAIMASFAFSPALNSSDDAETVQGYTQTTSQEDPCALSIDDCYVDPLNQNCTVGIGNIPVYKLEQSPTRCVEQLSFDDPDL